MNNDQTLISVREEYEKTQIGKILHNLESDLIGLVPVKKRIREIAALLLVDKLRRNVGLTASNPGLHMSFTGNPGTGKTTVARILAQIYKALGILERGNLVECDRQDLVGGFVGQTALKTTEVLNKAMGGVLFIDEAYALSEGGENDFGKEAVETILKKMEDSRGDFIVIVAGYTDNMKRFLESNPGLKSRFDREMQFEDYDAPQLHDIALKMLLNNGIKPTEEASNHIKQYCEFLYKTRNKFFGNARSVRKVIEEAIKNQHLRLAKTETEKRTKEMIYELVLEDVEEFKVDPNFTEERKTIGFK
jgi:probable Rubsico expression protein CbbX